MRYLILLLTSMASLAFAADDVQVPQKIRDAMATHKNKIMEIDNKAARLKGEVARETLERFDALVKEYTRAGDLDGALLARKMGDELVAGCGSGLSLEQLPVKDVNPQNYLGKWSIAKRYTITVSKDQTAVWQDPTHGEAGRWSYNVKAKLFVITWNNTTHTKLQLTSTDTVDATEMSPDRKDLVTVKGEREN